MPSTHLIELTLRVNQRNELRVLFARIHVKVVIGFRHPRRGYVAGADPVPFVTTFDCGSECVAGINEHVIAPAVSITIQEQRCLVESINDAVSRNVFRSACQSGKGRVQVRDVHDVPNNLCLLDHSGPPGEGGNAHAPLSEVALAAAIHHGKHPPARWRTVHHRTVVSHGHE